MPSGSWIREESRKWANLGIIEESQARQIAALYPEGNGIKPVTVLLILGVLLLGAGILLFFASNWQYIPRWGKVGLVVVPLMAFFLSSHLTVRSYPALSLALSALGCIMYGAGIWLMGQIFHINADFPKGFLLWLAGVLPVAFLFKEKFPLLLAAALAGVWVVAEHSASPLTVLLALLAFGALFYLTYNMRYAPALVICLASATAFAVTEVITIFDQWGLAENATFSLVFLVLLLAGQTLALTAKHPANNIDFFPAIFKIAGILLAGAALFAMSFEYFSQGIPKLHDYSRGMVLLWGLYLILAAAGAYVSARDSAGLGLKDIITRYLPWLSLDILIFLMLLVAFKPPALMLIINIYMFVWALALIFSAYQEQDGAQFTLGLLAFVIYTITMYFNFFWDMLPRSLFFMAGGLVLIAGGFIMERQRKKILRSWQGEGGGSNAERS